ncbi:hypothetical protein BJP34_04575 [Moorena producens PAL-8-15-08-1]|uniref:Filamentous haemagglutinin FhaB/tRNA nuclease CdiA-like TPS domain-containing protein n=1 Tax=Moorena producens PAL-8-15-08-1 TaxID=1458985 RepID=A0A1D8TMF4_9CYAN|nr:filamentous hemagglutinin N-terminal domain-containing protein [Moorena producens]AOW98821.1 hypothetical protein BJP34_04575 [Moorena producens PAL-8-15-08-1]
MKPRVYGLVQASSVLLCSLLGATTALGQITPDNTLGKVSSVVTPNVDVKGALADLIEGGAIRESNLFHSFSDFNVGEMGRVYFANPAGIANILSRVTGTNVSNILGTLGVLGNANLFVINPNGIFFGPNSRLDLGGSFFGSTADSVLFEDGTVFSAKNPNDKPLLTINIPSGLQYGSNPGSITNQSLRRRKFGERINGLQVPDGKTLGLIGGDITIPGGNLTAKDGRIELGSVGSNAVVNLTPTDSSFILDYSPVQEFQDISLSEGARVETSGIGGGSIQVQGSNVSLRDRSFIFANTLGSQNGGGIVVEASQLSLEGGSRITTDVTGLGQGGDLTVDATESVRVIGVSPDGRPSVLGARVLPRATGNGGDVSITTGQLIVSDGARVSVNTVGQGDGGNLTVDADSTVKLIGTSGDGRFPSGLFAETSGTGNGGDVSITTEELIVSDGARVSANTFGEGDGGNLTVDADSTVKLIGTSANGRIVGGLFAQANPGSTGNGGDVSITTGELIVKDGARVSTDTRGEGDGGSLSVDAEETVKLIGTAANVRIRSGLFARTQGTGKAGETRITTGELMVSDGAEVSASTFGEGDGGNVTVDADSTVKLIGTAADGRIRSRLLTQTFGTGNGGETRITTGQLIVKDGAFVSANTFGEGDGGSLSVDASESVQVIGISADGRFRSGLFAQTEGTGNGGETRITTGQLIVKDGAVVSASTRGEGDGGTLSVDASESVEVIGTSASGGVASGLLARTFGKGNAGDVSITTGQFMVSDGAEVSVGTSGEGDGGSLSVDAEETVKLIGTSADGQSPSGLFNQTFGTGNPGETRITTGQFIVSDGAVVSASTRGEGDGGTLSVDASESVEVIGSSADGRLFSGLFAQTFGTGNAGDLNITTGKLMVSDGAVVSARTFGEGDGGSLSVNADSSVQVIGTRVDGQSVSALTTQTDGTGKAGDLSITTGQLMVSDGAVVSAGTSGEGDGGSLSVDADSTVQLIGTRADGELPSGLFTQTEGKGNAGETRITTGQLIVSDGAQVSASTSGEGDGGSLSVDADSTVQLIGTSANGQFSSGLFNATEGKGNAGETRITTAKLMVSDGARVSASTSGEGDGGSLSVNASESIEVIGTSADSRFRSGLFAQTNPGSKGKAGDLSITTGELIVKDGARVSARTRGEGDGGTLSVDAKETIQLIGTSADGQFPSGLFTETEGKGDAGELLKITTGQLIVSDGAEVSARSIQQDTTAGEVKINAHSIFLDNKGRITAETAGGDNSKIKLFSRDIRLLNESLIITEAQNTTTGGNIEIDTDTLVGLGNSDIIANADEGEGGRVEINAKGIFGLEFRDSPTPDNDITSTSNRGSSFNGDVILNITQIDPTSGLNELPGILVDAEAILANDLCGFENNRIAGGSSFTITGKGGLPPTPDDSVINTDRTVSWRTRPGLASSRQALQQLPQQASRHPLQEKKVIIEAQGWVIAKDGTIILTAHPFRGTPVEQIFPNLDCHVGRGNREQGTGSREE